MVLHGCIVIEGLILPVGAGTCGHQLFVVVTRQVAVVELHLVHDHHVLLRVEDLALLPGVLPPIAHVVINAGLALRTLLGGDQDHTVGGTCPVDGCRGSILQDLHRLDIDRVEVVDATTHDHAVDNIKRFAVVNGTNTADAHLGVGTGLTGALCDLHTGDLTLEGILYARGTGHVQLIGGHPADGSSHHAFALHAIAHHHKLIQHLCILEQLYIEFGLVRDGVLPVKIADVGEAEGRSLRHSERIIAIIVSDGTGSGSRDRDVDSDHRLTVLIGHPSREVHLLYRRLSRFCCCKGLVKDVDLVFPDLITDVPGCEQSLQHCLQFSVLFPDSHLIIQVDHLLAKSQGMAGLFGNAFQHCSQCGLAVVEVHLLRGEHRGAQHEEGKQQHQASFHWNFSHGLFFILSYTSKR